MSQRLCLRCDHVWVSRVQGKKPDRCPNCNSPYWNKPRQERLLLTPGERLDRKKRLRELMQEKGLTLDQVGALVGKSSATIWKYTQAAGFTVPLEVLQHLEDTPVGPRRQALRCAIPSCGHEWITRTPAPPKICPACRGAHWQSGLSPVEARGALKRMQGAVGDLEKFAEIVGVSAEKLAPYFQGKPMNRQQLDALCASLRSKGYDFRYLD